MGVTPSPRPGLAELAAGEWEGLHRDQVLRPGSILRPGWSFRPPGGEGYADAEDRLKPVVEELKEQRGTCLVVGHFAINRVFLKLFLGIEEEAIMAADIPHQILYLLEEDRPVRWLSVQGREGEGLLPWKPWPRPPEAELPPQEAG
jgi:broad specificity phosphatase PhoE